MMPVQKCECLAATRQCAVNSTNRANFSSVRSRTVANLRTRRSLTEIQLDLFDDNDAYKSDYTDPRWTIKNQSDSQTDADQWKDMAAGGEQ